MNFRKEMEKWGNKIACKYLEQNNYKIIETNYTYKTGELDIIAKDIEKNELVFIYVKTYTRFKYGNPEDDVNKQIKKQIQFKDAIKNYLNSNKTNYNKIKTRIDIIEVHIKESCEIMHIKQILQLT